MTDAEFRLQVKWPGSCEHGASGSAYPEAVRLVLLVFYFSVFAGLSEQTLPGAVNMRFRSKCCKLQELWLADSIVAD